MNELGGDNFWVIHGEEAAAVSIDACGAAAGLSNIDFYRDLGVVRAPGRTGRNRADFGTPQGIISRVTTADLETFDPSAGQPISTVYNQ